MSFLDSAGNPYKDNICYIKEVHSNWQFRVVSEKEEALKLDEKTANWMIDHFELVPEHIHSFTVVQENGCYDHKVQKPVEIEITSLELMCDRLNLSYDFASIYRYFPEAVSGNGDSVWKKDVMLGLYSGNENKKWIQESENLLVISHNDNKLYWLVLSIVRRDGDKKYGMIIPAELDQIEFSYFLGDEE